MKKKISSVSIVDDKNKSNETEIELMLKKLKKSERLTKKLENEIFKEEKKKECFLKIQKLLEEEKNIMKDMLIKSKIH